MTLELFISTPSLSFFLSFNVFGTMDNRSAESVVYRRFVSFDSGSESESAKFHRLQLRLRLREKWSTPTDSNSGLDSDSAALVITGSNVVSHFGPRA